MSIRRTVTAIGLAAVFALPLFGCSGKEEPTPAKQDPNAGAQAMLNNPGLTAEQKAKIKEGMGKQGGAAPAGDSSAGK